MNAAPPFRRTPPAANPTTFRIAPVPAFPFSRPTATGRSCKTAPPSGLRTSRTGGTVAFALPASASQRSLRQTAPPFSGPMKTVLPPPPPLPAGCTTAVWIDSLRGLPAQSAAMRHKIVPPFSFTQQHTAIRCANAAFRRRNAPPIFFLRHQKENTPCTVEKKKCYIQTCTAVQVWGIRFLTVLLK